MDLFRHFKFCYKKINGFKDGVFLNILLRNLWCPPFVLPRQIYCSTIVSPALPLGGKCTNLISAKLKYCCLRFCYPLCSCVQQGRQIVRGWDGGTAIFWVVGVFFWGNERKYFAHIPGPRHYWWTIDCLCQIRRGYNHAQCPWNSTTHEIYFSPFDT